MRFRSLSLYSHSRQELASRVETHLASWIHASQEKWRQADDERPVKAVASCFLLFSPL